MKKVIILTIAMVVVLNLASEQEQIIVRKKADGLYWTAQYNRNLKVKGYEYFVLGPGNWWSSKIDPSLASDCQKWAVTEEQITTLREKIKSDLVTLKKDYAKYDAIFNQAKEIELGRGHCRPAPKTAWADEEYIEYIQFVSQKDEDGSYITMSAELCASVEQANLFGQEIRRIEEVLAIEDPIEFWISATHEGGVLYWQRYYGKRRQQAEKFWAEVVRRLPESRIYGPKNQKD